MNQRAVADSTVPRWPADLFDPFLDDLNTLDRVLHMSMSGIAMFRARPQAIRALGEYHGKLDAEELARAEKEGEFAQKEIDNGFPLLHQQATVSLWAMIESLIQDLVARWLEMTPGAWQVEAVMRLRVRIGDYETLDAQDRSLWVTELLDQEVAGPLRVGVTRFECLLQPFGLSGSVTEDCGKTLFELSQIRHVLVHRRGIADRRLIKACPWLCLTSGSPVKVSHEMWRKYRDAVYQYALELIQRLRVLHGLGRYEPNAGEATSKGEA